MKDREFDELVRRLELQARSSWRLYQTRVVLLAGLGYAYIGMVLLAFLAIVAGLIALIVSFRTGAYGLIKIMIIPAVAAWYIMKALWVKFDPPPGIAVTRQDAPRLFEEADGIATRLRAPRPDVVLITGDYNASVSQIPRLGIFGFPRNYLTVGLPLMATLPTGHVRSVLAHEFAHLSQAHGKFGAWCYRVKATWGQLITALEQDQHWSAGVFRWFFRWYVPYFSAYTFVAMRRHEFEADALAAEVVGPAAVAQTLVDLEVRGEYLSSVFWTQLWQEANENPEVPADVFHRLARLSTADADEEAVSRLHGLALQRRTDTNDTHPSLRERIDAVKSIAGTPEPTPALKFAENALATYLAPSHDRLVDQISADWNAHRAGQWKATHEAHRAAREGLAQLAQRDPATLSLDERFQLASWTEDVHGADAALPLLHAIHASNPEFVPATYFIGRMLAAKGDEAALRYLDLAIASDPEAIIPSCQVAIGFLEQRGRLDEVVPYRERLMGRATLLDAAQDERGRISHDDKFSPSDFPIENLSAVIAALDATPEVKRAWLVRKDVEHFAETPMHVLGVLLDWSSLKFISEGKKEARRKEVEQTLSVPDGVNLFVLTSNHYRITDRIKKVRGSLVYEASNRKAERQRAKAGNAADPSPAQPS